MKRDLPKKKLALGLAVAVLLLSTMFTPAINAGQTQAKEQGALEPSYDLLIITPSYWTDELQPLLDHKESIGMPTVMVTLDEVYEQMHWQGRDEAEQVKYFIQHSIETWDIDYVLLVGGMVHQFRTWHCPVRYISMGNDWEAQILSDLYFADIYDQGGNFSSWDSDEDGLFAEWSFGAAPEDTYIDMIPDIAIGRLPCRNAYEVKTMVKKIISYETESYGEDWSNDFIAIAGDTYPVDSNPLWEGYEGEYYADLAIENMSGYDTTRLYTSDESWSSKEDVIDAFKQGAGFIYLVGHGSPMSWGNNGPDGFVRGMWFYDIFTMNNKGKTPILVFSGCHNLQFDVTLLNLFSETARYRLEYPPESIGELITNWRFGGSVATLGCTALGHTKEDKTAFDGGINEFEVEMFHQHGQLGVDHLGDILKEATAWYVQAYPIDWDSSDPTTNEDNWVDMQVPATYILFGDPSMMIGGYPQ